MTTTQRYLGWDTSSVTGVVVAFETSEKGLRIVAEWALSLETSKHSERLLWTLDTVLQSAGWTLKDLSGLAVGVGPGSFTGLRIGMTTARMLAAQLNLPVVPISSLALLARGVVSTLSDVIEINPSSKKELLQTLVLVCTDATKGEWFTLMGSAQNIQKCVAAPEESLPGIWSDEVHEQAISSQVLLAQAEQYLSENASARWIAVGQSTERYPEEFKSLPADRRVSLTSGEIHRVHASILARMAYEAIQHGFFRDFLALKPRYLRASEAEVKLKKGLLKVSPTDSSILPRG